MKDGDNYLLYKLFMGWLAKKVPEPSIKTQLLAIPSYDRKHPKYLIKSFGEKFCLKNNILLQKERGFIQKKGSKVDRQNIKFKLIKDTFKRGQKVLILDDVLVTGGSVKSAISLLNGAQIEYIAVWAYRIKETFPF